MSRESDIVNLVQRLSTYLLEHRHASDTQEGIAVWWTGPGTSPAPDVLEAALACMVDYGVLVALKVADGRTHYHCRHELPDLEARLRSLAQGAQPPGGRGGRRLN